MFRDFNISVIEQIVKLRREWIKKAHDTGRIEFYSKHLTFPLQKEGILSTIFRRQGFTI